MTCSDREGQGNGRERMTQERGRREEIGQMNGGQYDVMRHDLGDWS